MNEVKWIIIRSKQMGFFDSLWKKTKKETKKVASKTKKAAKKVTKKVKKGKTKK